MGKSERRSMWHKYVNLAVLDYNTSYHTNIVCEPIKVFNGAVPYDVLDLKTGIRPEKTPMLNLQVTQDAVEQTGMIFQDIRKNAIPTYVMYSFF